MESYRTKAQQIDNLTNFIKCLDRVMEQRLYVYTELRRYAGVQAGQSDNVIVVNLTGSLFNPLSNPSQVPLGTLQVLLRLHAGSERLHWKHDL